MPTKKIVEVYSFHPLDEHGKSFPHFLFTKATLGKKYLMFLNRTPISQYRQKILLSNFSNRISKKLCIEYYIANQERLVKYYRDQIASIESELATLKYIDPEKIPSSEIYR